MKKLLIGATTALVGLALFAGPSFAKTSHTVIGKEVNASVCNQSLPPVVNIKYSVTNDADSGTLGNVWAFDNYNKTVQVWPQTDGSFCAVVKYMGQFVTNAGDSPQAATTDGTVGAGVQGTFEGGYIGTFSGVLNNGLQTNGDLGLYDYSCDLAYNCPGIFNWLNEYFPGNTNFAQSFWGWNYQAGSNGSWANVSTGNSGDITVN